MYMELTSHDPNSLHQILPALSFSYLEAQHVFGGGPHEVKEDVARGGVVRAVQEFGGDA